MHGPLIVKKLNMLGVCVELLYWQRFFGPW